MLFKNFFLSEITVKNDCERVFVFLVPRRTSQLLGTRPLASRPSAPKILQEQIHEEGIWLKSRLYLFKIKTLVQDIDKSI